MIRKEEDLAEISAAEKLEVVSVLAFVGWLAVLMLVIALGILLSGCAADVAPAPPPAPSPPVYVRAPIEHVAPPLVPGYVSPPLPRCAVTCDDATAPCGCDGGVCEFYSDATETTVSYRCAQ